MREPVANGPMSDRGTGPVAVAEVLKEAKREAFGRTHDPTVLGYVMYGDPNQKIMLRLGDVPNQPPLSIPTH